MLRTRHSITVETALSKEPDVSIDAKQMLYRVAQEALQNIAKHSQATSVNVSLFEEPPSLILHIQDNGRGFVVAGNYPGHLGLTSMRERAWREGASLTIDSTPEHGSSVRVVLPLR
jgi:signal transduction histidine kinase